MFLELTKKQIQVKNEFIDAYLNAVNAADGSMVDANANVSSKNIATMHSEMNKDVMVQINRSRIFGYLKKMYGAALAKQYIRQIEDHEIYKHDESSVMPYCAAVSLYPFLFRGLKDMTGESEAPKHLESFCGSFVNLMFALSSQFAGACLYKEQDLIFKQNDDINVKKIANFVSNYALNKSFRNYQGEWDYADVSGVNVWENGKFVKVKKVYRRKYSGKIYEIKTVSGKIAKVSEDHVFLVKYKGRDIEVKAKDLKLYDTVYNTMSIDLPIDKTSKDYIDGQFVGIIAGDGNITNQQEARVAVNTSQQYLIDFLDHYCASNFGKKGKSYEDKRTDKYVNYYIGSTKIVQKIRENFIGGFDHSTKNIALEQKTLNWLLGFLDGILVTDGCYNNQLTITLSNKGLVQTIARILEQINVHVKVTQVKVTGNRKPEFKVNIPLMVIKYLDLMNKKRQHNCRYNNAETKEVFYYGKNCFFQAKNVTQKGYMRVTDYQGLKAGNEPINFDCIESMTTFDNDDKYVYEIETESHWYSCGGILTHNCATAEWLTYFDFFARKDFGDNYLETHRKKIENSCQHCLYALNQPAAARGYQAVFWNISIFDESFFKGLFGQMVFPAVYDSDKALEKERPDLFRPNWESVNKLQKFFMTWFNKERERALLTFPVVTVAMVTDKDTGKPKDDDFAQFVAKEMSEGNSFFTYMSSSVDSLSSCCRLRNEINDNTFSYTLGAVGVMTGSKSVITLNMNRFIQDKKNKWDSLSDEDRGSKSFEDYLRKGLKKQIEIIHKYHTGYQAMLDDFKNAKLLSAYEAGFIDLKRQYLTIGINGLIEGCEFLGYEPTNNSKYINFVSSLLKVIYDANKEGNKKYRLMFNTELVPAENLGVKNAKWDKEDGYVVPRDCYNSYFYCSEDDSVNAIDKFILHGKEVIQWLDGGSALHLNLREHLSQKQNYQLLCIAGKTGCSYFCINVMTTCCEDCGVISKQTLSKCPSCGSINVVYATRIIGYLKKIKSFSAVRRTEASQRYYHGEEITKIEIEKDNKTKTAA